MAFGIQIKIKGEWLNVAPTGGDPYRYATKPEAEHILWICYPDQLRTQRLGGEVTVRVHKFEE